MPEPSSQEASYTLQSSAMIAAVHPNVGQDVIFITSDRAFRHLFPWCQAVEKHNSWVGPLSLAAALWLALYTADFKPKLDIPKETWFALFLAGALAATIWLVMTLKRQICNPPLSVDQIIERLKQPPTTDESSTVDKQG